jgi:hypothetical protein|nr:MAG TPA: tail tube protein [Caudoviricetes sp.]
MKEIQSKQVVYGTYGAMWIDGFEIAEIQELKATLSADKVEVKIARKMSKGYKVTGYTGKGSFKVHKVSSYFIKKLAPSIKEGKQVLCTIISKVEDPDALGTERIALYNCLIDSVDLINWSVGKLGEESYNFSFEDFSILDQIEG